MDNQRMKTAFAILSLVNSLVFAQSSAENCTQILKGRSQYEAWKTNYSSIRAEKISTHARRDKYWAQIKPLALILKEVNKYSGTEESQLLVNEVEQFHQSSSHPTEEFKEHFDRNLPLLRQTMDRQLAAAIASNQCKIPVGPVRTMPIKKHLPQ